MPDRTYDEAVRIAAQLGGVAPQSTLQRRLRLGYQDAHALQDLLVAEGHLDAEAVAADHAAHLQRALSSYAQAARTIAAYEASGIYGPRDGFSGYPDAAQVARDSYETARVYGATAAQFDDALKGLALPDSPPSPSPSFSASASPPTNCSPPPPTRRSRNC